MMNSLGLLMLVFSVLLPAATAAAPTAKPLVVAVIDFRTQEFGAEFRTRFQSSLDAALRNSGLKVRTVFETALLPRDSFEPEVRRLEALRPDIYYATTTDIARDIRKFNAAVPVVFSGLADPRVSGLIQSIDRPENNMTGFVSYEDVDSKRLEILADLNPRIKRIGIMVQKDGPAHKEMPKRIEFAKALGVTVVPLVFAVGDDAGAIPALIRRHRLDGLDVPSSVFARLNHAAIIGAARKAGIPASFRSADFVEVGAVLSYEPREFDYPDKAAQVIARVLQGTTPVDIPIEFPSEFVLSINMTAAAALPFALNKNVLRRANRLFR
jgi:putative ABC transport system substrate-binding protein